MSKLLRWAERWSPLFTVISALAAIVFGMFAVWAYRNPYVPSAGLAAAIPKVPALLTGVGEKALSVPINWRLVLGISGVVTACLLQFASAYLFWLARKQPTKLPAQPSSHVPAWAMRAETGEFLIRLADPDSRDPSLEIGTVILHDEDIAYAKQHGFPAMSPRELANRLEHVKRDLQAHIDSLNVVLGNTQHQREEIRRELGEAQQTLAMCKKHFAQEQIRWFGERTRNEKAPWGFFQVTIRIADSRDVDVADEIAKILRDYAHFGQVQIDPALRPLKSAESEKVIFAYYQLEARFEPLVQAFREGDLLGCSIGTANQNDSDLLILVLPTAKASSVSQ